jgi:hypothetical protein
MTRIDTVIVIQVRGCHRLHILTSTRHMLEGLARGVSKGARCTWQLSVETRDVTTNLQLDFS